MSKRSPSATSPHEPYKQNPKKSRPGGEAAEQDDAKQEEGVTEDEIKINVAEQKAKPVGEVVRTSGRGRSKMLHYAAFEIRDKVIGLEEAMLLVPEQAATKPYIGILKDVRARPGGGGRNVTLRVQWLYRADEALKEGGEPWPALDREIFLSFHFDDVTAEAVMHKCVVNYVSPAVDLEEARSKRNGFFVRRLYDLRKKVLWDLTDFSSFKKTERKQIERLLQQTQEAWAGSLATQDQTTATQQHALATQQLILALQQQTPALLKQTPATQHQTLVTQQQTPVTQQQNPALQQQTPALQQQISATQQQNSATQQQTPAMQQKNPALQQQIPATQQQISSLQQQTPATQ